MAGSGQRFLAAGFKPIKPLIPLGAKTMIEHAVSIFPNDASISFIFICNSEHLKSTGLEELLKKLRPNCKIIGIAPHKIGPVHSILQVEKLIDDSDEAIVSYCDFEVDWDYSGFMKAVHSAGADGAIAAFRGFQAAQLTGTTYAYLRTDGMKVLEIREKKSFTEHKESEFASTGTYYFKSGATLKKYLARAVAERLEVNGEYYASLPFNPMISDGLNVIAYEVKKFICFGTPADVQLYNFWYEHLRGEKP